MKAVRSEGMRYPRRLVAADVMTRSVITAPPNSTFKELERLMAGNHISAVPIVTEDGALVGIVSEADLMLKKEWRNDPRFQWHTSSQQRAERAKAQGLTAADVMTTPVTTVDPGMPLSLAARKLHKRGIKRLPVVDDGRLVGILSRGDILKSYLRSDEEIRADVVEGVMRRWLWIDPTGVDVDVEEGVVTIRGELERRSDAEMLSALTEGVEGVVAVDAKVSYKLDDRALTAAVEHRLS